MRDRGSVGSAAVAAFAAILWVGVAWATGRLTAPASGDEGDYLARGRALAEIGLAALADGGRPPLMPALVAGLEIALPGGATLPAVRVANLLLLATLPGLWWRAEVPGTGPLAGRLMAVFIAIWPPLWLLAAEAYAEAPAFWCLGVALRLVLMPGLALAAGAGLALGAVVLAKAHGALLVPVFAGACLCRPEGGRAALVLVVAAATTLAPWAVWLSLQTGGVALTTTLGRNLLVGTGAHDFGMGGGTAGDPGLARAYLRAREPGLRSVGEAETALGKVDLARLEAAAERPGPAARLAEDRLARALALSRWAEAPEQRAAHGLRKIAHAFGGSGRGAGDALVLALTVAGLAAGAALLARAPAVAVLVFAAGLAAALNAFVFLENIRLKTLVFDLPALLALAGLAACLRRRCRVP
ncbi:MAG: hypothetical protein ACFBSD_08350 [Paracoccaceae bacterium]